MEREYYLNVELKLRIVITIEKNEGILILNYINESGKMRFWYRSKIVSKVHFPNRHKPIGHFYVDSPAPSLHGNNTEIGAKTVNIKMSYRFIRWQLDDILAI